MTIQLRGEARLPDGRRLSYAECGRTGGFPILHCHGTPSSRFEAVWPQVDQVAGSLGVRLILPDRPGIGRSTPRPGRTLLDWAADVRDLMDSLGVEHFAVMGISGGGPFAAACAYRLPERVTALALVSAVGPIMAPAVWAGFNPFSRLIFGLARRAPLLLWARVWWWAQAMRRAPDRTLSAMARGYCPADQAVVRQPEVTATLKAMAAGALQQGIAAAAGELTLFARAWGFSPAQIRPAVSIWHGEADSVCPAAMGRSLAELMPAGRVHFFPGAGHYSMTAHHYAAILEELCELSGASEVRQPAGWKAAVSARRTQVLSGDVSVLNYN